MSISVIKSTIDGMIHINASSQYEIASMFMRVQEFYESKYSTIRGKYFTVEEYMDTYRTRTIAKCG